MFSTSFIYGKVGVKVELPLGQQMHLSSGGVQDLNNVFKELRGYNRVGAWGNDLQLVGWVCMLQFFPGLESWPKIMEYLLSMHNSSWNWWVWSIGSSFKKIETPENFGDLWKLIPSLRVWTSSIHVTMGNPGKNILSTGDSQFERCLLAAVWCNLLQNKDKEVWRRSGQWLFQKVATWTDQ